MDSRLRGNDAGKIRGNDAGKIRGNDAGKIHDNFLGANYTKKKSPVKLVYSEEYSRIDEAFNREKQVQGWSHDKKKALVEGHGDSLPELSIAYRDKDCFDASHFENLSDRS